MSSDSVIAAIEAATPRLEALEASFLACDRPFSCSGSIPLRALPSLRLFYTTKDKDREAGWAPFPLSPSDTVALYDAGAPSPFGRGDQLVHDDTYRSARELVPPAFALSHDVLDAGLVLPDLSRRLACERLVAHPTKLNTYAVGGFFKAHRDTPHGNHHIGTLTVCLPSEFTGGELVVRHRGKSVTYDWGTGAAGASGRAVAGDGKVVSWAFLYNDCQHEILPVTSGTRVTVAYDVCTAADVPSRALLADSASMLMTELLRDAIADPSFYPQGRALAFGLQHAYACSTFEGRRYEETTVDPADLIGRQLKGADAAWLVAIMETGLKWDIKAVFDYDLEEADERWRDDAIDWLEAEDKKSLEAEEAAIHEAYEEDARKPRWYGSPAYKEMQDKLMKARDARLPAKAPLGYKQRRCLASDSFYFLEECAMGDGLDPEPIHEEGRKIDELGTDWVVETKEFGGTNTWMSHGNEVSTNG
jgi:hypothetical protein